MTKNETESTAGSRFSGCIGWIFCGVFALIGSIVFVFLAVIPVWQIIRAQSWEAVDCTILTSEVESHSGSDSDTYSIAITYAFELGGQEFTGDRYNFSNGSSSGYNGKAAVVDRYPPGSQTLCFVDPNTPSSSVINRSPGWFLLWGLFPIPFMLIGFGGFYALIRWGGELGKPKRRAKKSFSRRQDPVTQDLDPQQAALLAKLDGRPEIPEIRPGPLVLESESSRVINFVVIGIFSVFWNGFVGFFAVDTLRGDGTSWFMLLFLSPFVLAGIAMIGATIHQGLAIFNPKIHLTLSDGDLRLGETYSVSWKLDGRSNRLQQLTLSLEGREQATYRRGTDTRTEHSVFHRHILVDEQRLHFTEGSFSLPIPRDSVPSFKAQRNEIQWRILVAGDIPFWPDVSESFQLWVSPPKAFDEERS